MGDCGGEKNPVGVEIAGMGTRKKVQKKIEQVEFLLCPNRLRNFSSFKVLSEFWDNFTTDTEKSKQDAACADMPGPLSQPFPGPTITPLQGCRRLTYICDTPIPSKV